MRKGEILDLISKAYWDAMGAAGKVMADPTTMPRIKRSLEVNIAILDARAEALAKLAREIEDDQPTSAPRPANGTVNWREDLKAAEETLRAYEGMQIADFVDQNPYLSFDQKRSMAADIQKRIEEIKTELKERKRRRK